VAAIERRVNRTVYKLLKGYLFRSVWLYATVGLTQYFLVGLYWQRGWGLPIAAAQLGLWGAFAAVNANSLVWRSLPIAAKDASAFRWWAMVGVPGIYLTLLMGITCAAHLASGFPIAASEIVWEAVFANWAVLGIVAVVFRSPRFYEVRGSGAKVLVAVSCANMSASCAVTGPGLPLPIGLPSTASTGVRPPIVPVTNISSAQYSCVRL